MKIYILEFYYFCGIQWREMKGKIMANSVEEIKTTFYKQVDIPDHQNYKGLKKAELWEEIKRDVYFIELPYFEREESNQ